MADFLVLEAEGLAPAHLYLHEILEHGGLFYETRSTQAPGEEWPPLLLLMGRSLPSALRERIARHVAQGGLLLCLGATLGLEEVLGVASPEPAAEGWLELRQPQHPAVAGLEGPLHIFGGTTVVAQGATELASLHGRAAVTWHRYGQGHALFLGADVPFSVLHIQQGIPVERDGKPAPDGTAPLDDGILKAEDGMVLDWERDRQVVHVPRGLFPGLWGQGTRLPENLPPPDVPQPFPLFLEPVADLLRALLLKGLFALASAGGVALRMLWYWPRGLPAVAHLSHDTDGNDPEMAEALRQVCREVEVASTWCILYPGGYPPRFYRRLQEEGFEIALHYDARSGGPVRSWSQRNLGIQAQWLRDMTGLEHLHSNKNHYTRWEGRLEFFRWCEEEGLGVEQSKGPSKTGTVGFPFGTCHPWFPLDDEAPRPRWIPVLALPLLTQDLVITAPAAYAELLTKAVRKHYGVAHFLYHPAHITKAGVADSLRRLVEVAREQGMEWWTSARIRDWEEERRALLRETKGEEDALQRASQRLPGATLLRLLPRGVPCPQGWEEVERYGFRFAQRWRG